MKRNQGVVFIRLPGTRPWRGNEMILSLEAHVTSLGLSKKLKALGVRRDSLFSWWPHTADHMELGCWELSFTENLKTEHHFAAYTASELGELLPRKVLLGARTCYLMQRYSGLDVSKSFFVAYFDSTSEPRRIMYQHTAHTEAEARGELLARLLEKGITSECVVPFLKLGER